MPLSWESVSLPVNSSSDSRTAAALILARVDAHKAHAARLLRQATPLTRALVLTTLRWQLTADSLLQPYLQRPLEHLDAPVRACLRMGAVEAFKLDTPVPVAVAEAVRVCKILKPQAAGLVNACLRRAVQGTWPKEDDESIPLWLRYSHPQWLVNRWASRMPAHLLRQTLAADQLEAPIYLLEAVSRLAVPTRPHPWVPGVVMVEGPGKEAAAQLTQGRAYAMDPHAVLVARLLPKSRKILEMAAAPGGKSLVLGLEQPDSLRLALDLRLGRARLLAKTVRLLYRPPHVLVADGRKPPLRSQSFDAVLLDAPCSGTGTLRRHPEIRWRLQPAHLQELASLQRALLQAAVALTAPGGFVLYATCSLEPEENEQVVQALALPTVPLADKLPAASSFIELPSGGALLPPGPWGDGFVIHLLGPLTLTYGEKKRKLV